jgi:hypothetical protein
MERGDELVAMSTTGNITYNADQVLGTPDQPTAISFLATDQLPNDGKWYTVGGILVGKKPTKSGVYIHDGKTVIIKK